MMKRPPFGLDRPTWLLAPVLAVALLPIDLAAQQLFNGVNYQAILRDESGDLMQDQTVSVVFAVRQNNINGPFVLFENQTLSTNEHGLVSTVIGQGGELANLDYANTAYFLRVYVDSYELTPAQRLEAVPMAYKATNMRLKDLVDVQGEEPISGQALIWNDTTWVPTTLSGGGGASQWQDHNSGIHYSSGSVGVGTTPNTLARMRVAPNSSSMPVGLNVDNAFSGVFPKYGLDVSASSAGSSTRYGVRASAAGNSNGSAAYGLYGHGTATAGSASPVYGVFGLASSSGTGAAVGVFGRGYGTGTGVYGHAPDANGTAIRGVADQNNGFAAQFDGDVRVNGTASQLYLGDNFTLFNYSTNGAPRMTMNNAQGTNTVDITSQFGSGGSRLMLRSYTGITRVNLYVGANNRGRVVTDELQITGGADLAEHFAVEMPEGRTAEPGMLVSIAADGSGNLVPSTTAYDPRVAGVVSGANGVQPGLVLGQEGTTGHGEVPVALNGRVYVRADATNGPIRPGDLLTTSDRPGHAMRATDRDRAHGTTVGKAMTALHEGVGFVLVLVNLQ